MASEEVCRVYLRDIIERRDRSGLTPLHYAVKNNEINFIRFLIEAGADVNAKDNNGNTPLNMFPVSNIDGNNIGNYFDILVLLISKGADINNKNRFGKTILHSASEQDKIEFVESLLEQGANINVVDNDGDTPLHYAVNGRHEIMVELLLQHHADIIKNNHGETPLDIAEDEELDDITEMLSEYIKNLPEVKEPETN
jgi:ankyrin repeat protein